MGQGFPLKSAEQSQKLISKRVILESAVSFTDEHPLLHGSLKQSRL